MWSWADLVGRRVVVWGLGTEGRATLRRLRTLGIEPVIVDDAPERVADEAALATSGEGLAAMLAADVVFKTPGISAYRPEAAALRRAGVPVVGGLGLWLAGVDRSKVLVVTGTKGKSTTTSIAAHLARGLGLRVFAGGNLGTPPFDVDAPAFDEVDLWVIEASSYQVCDLEAAPPVVVVTSLSPDHLPWHGSEERYYADKLSIATRPGVEVVVASAESPLLVERASLLGEHVRWVDRDTYRSEWAEPLGLRGAHNLVNANIARAALEAMGIGAGVDGGSGHDSDDGGSDDAWHRAADGFGGLEARLETVAVSHGVEFVDDGLSTNVLPTIAAVEAFGDRPVALLCGGFDRGIDYSPLADALARRSAPTFVVTAYSTGPAIAAACRRAGASPALDVADSALDVADSAPEVAECASLAEQVRVAFAWARERGGVVLLSPAAASFDAFDDYRDKGRAFRAAIAAVTV